MTESLTKRAKEALYATCRNERVVEPLTAAKITAVAEANGFGSSTYRVLLGMYLLNELSDYQLISDKALSGITYTSTGSTLQ